MLGLFGEWNAGSFDDANIVLELVPNLVEQSPVFLTQGRLIKQVGAVAESLGQGRSSPPATDFFVIAGKQNFWDGNAAKFRRAGEMWIVE